MAKRSTNLTLKSITKMEAVLGADIILTPLKAAASLPQKKVYVTVQVDAPQPYISPSVIPTFRGINQTLNL